MEAAKSTEDLLHRIRVLEHQNRFLQYQKSLLQEAVETICYAFLNNPKDLDTSIRAALTLQERASQPPDSHIKPW